ncbi:MAG TPA: ABC transporter ATP-binding protein [Marmoricola sp.]|jgi:peptide/nickel transport system ATP-binding protein/oligopeptide transport system ATP-binding protein|nr:ABC transporter ATP-binding protein [Marmoricola sp.]
MTMTGTEPRENIATAPLVRADDLEVHFRSGGGLRPTRTVRAVDGVSLAVAPGETLGLVGESGCGKSTLGRALLRLLPLTSGTLSFEGQDISGVRGARLRRLRADVQAVFQDPLGSLNPRMTIADAVAEPLREFVGGDRRVRRERVRELFEMVGLDPNRMGAYPRQMSGGQLQRVGIARAIAVDPKFIVADEVVSALDVSVQAQIINLLVELRERNGLSYVFIGHDVAVVRHISHRVAVMYLGKIMETGDALSVFDHPRHPYTASLMSAVQVPDPTRRREQISLQGELPSPTDVPSGCRFRTRCPFAQEQCALEEPPLREVAPGRQLACHFPL